MTTSGRSSAILDGKNRQLCKGFDVIAVRTTSGVDSTVHPSTGPPPSSGSLLGYGYWRAPAT